MLGADIAAALPELRAEAESRMTDTVIAGVYRAGTDPVTGDPTRVLVTEHYAGKARIRWGSRNVTNANGASQPVAVQEPFLSVPFGAARLFTDDEVEMVGSLDPVLVGRRFRVAGNAIAGDVTAHRYPLEEPS